SDVQPDRGAPWHPAAPAGREDDCCHSRQALLSSPVPQPRAASRPAAAPESAIDKAWQSTSHHPPVSSIVGASPASGRFARTEYEQGHGQKEGDEEETCQELGGEARGEAREEGEQGALAFLRLR